MWTRRYYAVKHKPSHEEQQVRRNMNDQPTSADVQELLRRAYTAFNARDIDAVCGTFDDAPGRTMAQRHGGWACLWTRRRARVLDAPVVSHQPPCRTASLQHKARWAYPGRSKPARARQGRQYALGWAGAAHLHRPRGPSQTHGNTRS